MHDLRGSGINGFPIPALESHDGIGGVIPILYRTTLKGRYERTMDKVTKEELMKKLNLTEEELEKIAGGTDGSCPEACIASYEACLRSCNGSSYLQQQCYDKECTRCTTPSPEPALCCPAHILAPNFSICTSCGCKQYSSFISSDHSRTCHCIVYRIDF